MTILVVIAVIALVLLWVLKGPELPSWLGLSGSRDGGGFGEGGGGCGGDGGGAAGC